MTVFNKPAKGDVESLKVYQMAYKLSLEVHKASLEFPKIGQFGGIADQIRRCSKSVCANLIEGHAKKAKSKVEFNRFVWIAIGSAKESKLWCRYALDLGYLD